MIELHPASLRLLGLRHWQQRRKPMQPEVMTQVNPPGPTSDNDADTASLTLSPQQQVLLEKILAAVGLSTECCRISVLAEDHVRVTLADGFRLEFNELCPETDKDHLALAGLAAMLAKPELKKPVWKKLKAWRQDYPA